MKVVPFGVASEYGKLSEKTKSKANKTNKYSKLGNCL
jgi:hypothetical protein